MQGSSWALLVMGAKHASVQQCFKLYLRTLPNMAQSVVLPIT